MKQIKRIGLFVASIIVLALFMGCATTQAPSIPEGFVSVKSKYIDAIQYAPETEELTVRYEDTCVHRIPGVSLAHYLAFMATPGKKGYFMAHFDLLPHEIVPNELAKKPRYTRLVGMRYAPNGRSQVIYQGPPTFAE